MERYTPTALTSEERAELDAKRRAFDEQIDVIRSEKGQGLREKIEAHGKTALSADALQQSLENSN